MSKTIPSKRKTSGVLRTLRARTQSATAHLTAEEDWDTEVPNIRLSRVFAIVLILHVVAVGGILAFQIMNPDSAGSESTAKSGQGGQPVKGAAQGSERIDQPVVVGGGPDVGGKQFGPDVEGLQHYRVQSGDTPMSIARRFEVNVTEFERINKLGAGKQLYPGLIVFLPNKTIQPNVEDDARRLLEGTPSPEVAGAPRAIPVDGSQPDTVPRPLRIDEEAGVVRPTAARPAAPAPGSAGVPAPRDERPAGWSGNASPRPGTEVAPEPAPRPEVVAPAPQPKPQPQPKPATETETSVAEFRSYEVQAGDTAFGLGRKFGVKPDALLRLNGIEDPTKLRAGTVIRIPVRN